MKDYIRKQSLHARARLKYWRRAPVRSVDHDAVLAHVESMGGWTPSYAVLIALSCGIAILGLLLSSAAVVIGAMLISPLMNPIVALGFSLATLNTKMALTAAKAIGLGAGFAVLLAALIVKLSPLDTPTAEILARTTPNFFDLLVAVFSALAGGYAVITRKGEAVVGVAIATSLMPPLAVVGYGIAVGSWTIAGGAAGLFMTNTLAIALTMSLLAHFFGFGAAHPFKTRAWQSVAILSAFAVLSIPLGLSLQHIARETVLATKAKAVLNSYFAARNGHVYGVDIRFPKDRPIQISALALTENEKRDAEITLRKTLRATLGQPVQLSLSQVPIHPHEALDRRAVSEMIGESTMALSQSLQDDTASIEEFAAAAARVTPLDVSTDRVNKTLVIRADGSTAQRLADLHQADTRLKRRFPAWQIITKVDPAELPALSFAPHSDQLTLEGAALLPDLVWALNKAGITAVHIRLAPETAHRRAALKLAKARGETVAKALEALALSATVEVTTGPYSGAALVPAAP